MYIYTQTKIIRKKLPINFKPHYYTYTHTQKKNPQETHSRTHRRKITVNEIQNHSKTHTYTHTHTKRQKHIKYQRGVKQTKVKLTLRKREDDLYLNL